MGYPLDGNLSDILADPIGNERDRETKRDRNREQITTCLLLSSVYQD